MKIKVFLLSIAILLTSCSDKNKKQTIPEPKKEVTPVPTENTSEQNKKTAMTIEGDLGTIDREMVQKKFDESKTEVENCVYKGLGTKRYIGGNFNFIFRINTDGTVKHLSMKTTVGNRVIEKCIYEFAKGLQFVKPEGGEAKVSFSWGFDPSMEVKKNWTGEDLGSAYRKLKRKLIKCSDGTDEAPAEYTLIFYLIPDAKVASIGVSSGKQLVSDKFFKCVKRSVKRVKFPDPMGTVAKVTLEISSN